MKPILRAASAFSVVFASALTLTIGLTPGDARAQAGPRNYAVEGDCDGRPATGVRMALDAFRQTTGTAGGRQVEGAKNVQTLNIGGSTTTTVSLVIGRD